MLTDLPDTLASLIMPRFHGEALAAVNALIESERLATVDQLKAHIDQFLPHEPSKAKQREDYERGDYSDPAWRPKKHAAFLRSFRQAHPDGERMIADVVFSYPAGAPFPADAYERLKSHLGLKGKQSHQLTAVLRELNCKRNASHQWYTPVLRRGVA